MEKKQQFKVGDRFIVVNCDGIGENFLGVRGVVSGDKGNALEFTADKPIPKWYVSGDKKTSDFFTLFKNSTCFFLELEDLYDSPLYQALK